MNATTRLLLATLALGLASGLRAGTTITPAVVYCKARIMPSGLATGNEVLSVTLPPTPGYADQYGNPVTVWNPGNVTAGGVADSWHEGGPGFFNVRNTGNVEAYVYVVALSYYDGDSHVMRGAYGDSVTNNLRQMCDLVWQTQSIPNYLGFLRPRPTPRASYDEEYNSGPTYHLALTTDMTSAAPVWRPLDHATDCGSGSPWQNGYDLQSRQCSAYLGPLAVGDYQPFDLKFWAPGEALMPPGEGVVMTFIFTVEAASFPRWEHDR